MNNKETSAPKVFPPKILGLFCPGENNGRWQGPYRFCPEQWSLAYDYSGQEYVPHPGEDRDVLFISLEEHEFIMKELESKLDIAREALEWYANWDWTDKYVQPIPKKAKEALAKLDEEGK